MLVNNFMPPMESDMLRHPRGQTKKDQVLPRVHTGLEVIVDLVPLAALKLSTTVVQKRPMFFRKDFNMDRLKFRVSYFFFMVWILFLLLDVLGLSWYRC